MMTLEPPPVAAPMGGPTARPIWRRVAFGLVAWFAVYFVTGHRNDLRAAITIVGHARPGPLGVAVLLSIAAVVNRGLLSLAGHRAAGLEAELGSMTRVTAAAYALNKVVKTGGVGGVALFVRHGHTERRAPGRVVAAYAATAMATQVALVVVVVASVVLMTLTGSLTGPWLAATIGFALVTTTGLAIAARALASPGMVRRLYLAVRRLHARARRQPANADQTDDPHVDHFLDAVAAIRRSPTRVVPLLFHAVAAKMLGAAVLTMALAATGSSIGYASTLTVYALALVAGTASLLPGGIGPVEASMAAVLGVYGVPVPAAVAGVAVFRLLDLWFPLLVGLMAARRLPIAHRTTSQACTSSRT